jgi:hypothetical protein
MNKIKSLLIGALLGAAAVVPSFAGTITFEDMPNDYLFYGGQQNFGNYWEGVYFGPSSTILDAVRYGYNSSGYPAHSGTSVLFSISTPYIDAIFDNTVDFMSFWYTANGAFSVSAYDSADNLLSTQNLANNYTTNSYVSVSSAGMDIKRIRFSGTGNYFTIDDFTADIVTGRPKGESVPDTGATLGLLAFGIATLAGLRRKIAA